MRLAWALKQPEMPRQLHQSLQMLQEWRRESADRAPKAMVWEAEDFFTGLSWGCMCRTAGWEPEKRVATIGSLLCRLPYKPRDLGVMGKSRSHRGHSWEAGPGTHGRWMNATEPILLKSLLADLDIRCFSCSSTSFLKSRGDDSSKRLSGRKFCFYWIRLYSVFLGLWK